MTSLTTSRSARPATAAASTIAARRTKRQRVRNLFLSRPLMIPCQHGWSFPDVSVVDGVNLNMDVQPVGPRTEHMPGNPKLAGSSAREMRRGSARRSSGVHRPGSSSSAQGSPRVMFIEGSPGRGRCGGLLVELRAAEVPGRTEQILLATPTPLRTSGATTGRRSAPRSQWKMGRFHTTYRVAATRTDAGRCVLEPVSPRRGVSSMLA